MTRDVREVLEEDPEAREDRDHLEEGREAPEDDRDLQRDVTGRGITTTAIEVLDDLAQETEPGTMTSVDPQNDAIIRATAVEEIHLFIEIGRAHV